MSTTATTRPARNGVDVPTQTVTRPSSQRATAERGSSGTCAMYAAR